MILRKIALMVAVLFINVSSNYIEELIARSQGSTRERLEAIHAKITQSGFVTLFELKVYARNLVHVAGSFDYDRERFVQIFVRLLHEAIQDGGALRQERINEIWLEAIQEVNMSQERSQHDQRLQESIAQSGYVPTSLLGIAIAQGDVAEIDKLLAEATYDINQHSGEAIFVAVLQNDVLTVRKLLAAHVDIAAAEAKCLWSAMTLGYDEIVCLLADYEGNDSN